MEKKFNVVGKITRVGGAEFKIVHTFNYEDIFYIAVNLEIFESAHSSQRQKQRIIQVVSNTIFVVNDDIIRFSKIDFIEDKYEQIFKNRIINKDISFSKIVNGAENSDYPANISIFKNVKKVSIYEELDNLDNNILRGYSGDILNVIVCEVNDIPQSKTKIYIEKIDSYPEGYVCEYFEIPDFMFTLIRTGKVDDYFLFKNKV